MSEITGALVDEADDLLTMETIMQAKRILANKTIRPIFIDGHQYYPVILEPKAMHQLQCAVARSDWYDYYRAVRIMRRILRNDVKRCEIFRKVCA